jgi:hypothetical protein
MGMEQIFIQGLEKILDVTVVTNKDEYQFIQKAEDGDAEVSLGTISKAEIAQIEDDLKTKKWEQQGYLVGEDSLEVAVQIQNTDRYSAFSLRKGIEERMNGCTISIGNVSTSYMFSLIYERSRKGESSRYLNPFNMYSLPDEIKSLNEIAQGFFISTIKVNAPNKCEFETLKKMVDSFIFNISYNHSVVYSIMQLEEERKPRKRPLRTKGQLYPFLEYIPDLSTYYYQGVSTNIAFTQYLAYYHIAEFYLQTISENEAISEIKRIITHPSFSPHNRENIRQFYEKIRKIMRDQRDDGVWNEKTGLLLCIKKFIPDLSKLKASILRLDKEALDYYQNINVEFADSSKTINFGEDPDKIYNDIRDRVYATRNAIVHSKDGEQLRYEPFKHDHSLEKEIPLIRSIAEEIILSTAKELQES